MRWFAVSLGFILLLVFWSCVFVVQETEQVILTQFGKPVGAPIATAGLHFKLPFVQEVHSFDKRVLEWDGPSAEMPTRDKLYLVVDAFGRWQITDPLAFFLRFRDERSAQSRLDDILGSEMRNTIARHDLVELVRTDKARTPTRDVSLDLGSGVEQPTSASGHPAVPGTSLPAIQLGRVKLEEEVSKAAAEKLAELGMKLLDFRFKRINYNRGVASKIFERMISERRQIAERFRSEGAGEAAKIIGQRERDLQQIQSEAYYKVQLVQGKADAEASGIYAGAFNQTEGREFYGFLRTMETYRTSFTAGTTVVLTTDSSLMKYLKGEPGAAQGPGKTNGPPPVAPPAPAPPVTP